MSAQRASSPALGRADAWDTRAKIEANCARINESAANAAAAGLQVGYHNHWWEFDTLVDGQPVWRHMLELLDERVFFQIDTYWTQVGGADVCTVLKTLGPRAQVLHIKDGPADDPAADMVAVGSGVHGSGPPSLRSPMSTGSSSSSDRCATDMLQAVRDSAAWLIGKGYARDRLNIGIIGCGDISDHYCRGLGHFPIPSICAPVPTWKCPARANWPMLSMPAQSLSSSCSQIRRLKSSST